MEIYFIFGTILVAFLLFALILFTLHQFVKCEPFEIRGTHILVTGGSSGIGKSLAEIAIQKGARCVTILARNTKRLAEAKVEIEQFASNSFRQTVHTLAIDITQDFSNLKAKLKELEDEMGPVDVLVNCAGYAVARKFEDTTPEQFERQMSVNYFGSLWTTLALLPAMKKREMGRISFTSSVAGQMGLIGYSGYSASKFALRGLAESIQMEVKPYNIFITLAFPPDTNTPGFELEQIGKPEETKLVSEAGGMHEPQEVAGVILNDILKGNFLSSVGAEGHAVSCATAGLAPITNILHYLVQAFAASPMRFAALFLQWNFDSIINKCKERQNIVDKKT